MSLKACQKDVDKRTSQFDPQYRPPFELVAAMVEEVGEVSREMSHIYGIKKKKTGENTKDLGKELVDLLFTTICIANDNNINLQQEWEIMVKEKLNKRDKNRFKKKE